MHIPSTPPQRSPGLKTQVIPTATEVIAVIRGAPDLTRAQQDKLCTAVNGAIRALRPGEDPRLVGQHVLMSCATLTPLFRGPAAKHGMSPARFTSFRSELRRVLRRLGQLDPDRRGRKLESAAWRALADALPKERHLGLIDFFRFLEEEGIKPSDAGQDSYERYMSRCADRTLRTNPEARARQVAVAWNWGRRHIQGWPVMELTSPRRRRETGPTLEACPASLAEDLERYLASRSGEKGAQAFRTNIFAESARAAPPPRRLRAVTISNKRYRLQGVIQALLRQGVEPHTLRSLRDLLVPEERAVMALKHYVDRFEGADSTIPWTIAEELRLLARDHCQLPQEAIDRIGRWAKNLRPRPQTGLTRKNKQRLRALMQPLARAMLLRLPIELMKRARQTEAKPAAAALLAMYATALEILLICPMRRANLVGLRLDVHLHRPDPRKSRIADIFLPAGEVKNNEDIEWPVPAESARLIETYIRHYRPHLAAADNMYLFPGSTGTKPRSAQGLASWISKTISREIGIEFNLHLVRHFSAWNFLRLNPGHYETVRQILGHKDIQTTMAHYVGLDVDAAAKRFDAIVLGERQATRNIAVHAFRKGRGGRGSSRGGR